MLIIGEAVNCVIVRLLVAFRKRLPAQLCRINQQDDEAINKHTRSVNNPFCLLQLISYRLSIL